MINLDVVIPVFGKYEEIKNLLDSLSKQKDVAIKNIACSLTLSNTEVDKQIEELFKQYNVKYFTVTKDKFSHSKTREKLILDYTLTNVIIMLSQDVRLIDDYALYNLAKPIALKEAAYSYGRQLCPIKSIEKYTRAKNYTDHSFVINKNNQDQYGFLAYFSSDAFSCYDKEIFIKVGGYQGYDLMMNEDELYSYVILKAGYNKAYVAEAKVEHYHHYTFKNLYDRYYLAGSFYKTVKEFNDEKVSASGLKLAFYVLGQILINFDIVSLFRFIPDMLSRYLGLRKGRKS